MNHEQTSYSAAEIAYLWICYMADSMSVQVLRHFQAHCEDPDVREVQQYAQLLSERQLAAMAKLYEDEGCARPIGFIESDVNLEAPRLFADSFTMHYLYQMSNRGMVSYAKALSMVVHPGVHDYFTSCLLSAAELNTRVKGLLISKGLYARPPAIPKPTEAHMVERPSFLQGYPAKGRTLNALEIANTFHNIQSNWAMRTILLAFAQTARLPELRKLFAKGLHVAKDEADAFRKKLEEDHLPVTTPWDVFVTDTTQPVFSDKLMMFHAALVNGAHIEQFGFGMSTGIRSDLAVPYGKFMATMLRFAEDGANLMIDHRWLEMMPLAAKRKGLMKV